MNFKTLFVVLFLVAGLNLHSQENFQGDMTLSGQFGASTMAAWYYNNSSATNIDAIHKIPPAYQLNFDYFMLDMLSLGASFSYQRVSFIDRDHPYIKDGVLLKEDVTTYLTRLNFAYRILFHYVRSKTLDVYSGVRIGLNYHTSADNSQDPNYFTSIDPFKEYGFAPQILALGARIYVLENLAITAELGVGYPSFFSAGATFRL